MPKQNNNAWIKKLTASPSTQLRVLPSPTAPVDWLDTEARQLLRTGAMRLLQAVAGEEGESFDPRRSKDAIQALSLLFDRVPDVLSFDRSSSGTGALEGEDFIDLYSPDGQDYITRALEVLEGVKEVG